MEEETEKKYRMGSTGIVITLILATLADLLSLIPLIGDAVGPIFWVCISLYLWKIGCGLLNPRRLITEIISLGIEIVPVLQALPSIFIGMIIIIVFIRLEDKTGLKLLKPASATSGGRTPLYQNGQRLPPQIQQMASQPNPQNIDGVRAPNGGLVN